MSRLKKIILVVIIAANVSACNGTQHKEQQSEKPLVAVETATSTSSALLDVIDVTGSLEPKFSVDIKTQIPGLLKQVFVTEWVRVKKGQPLARIDMAETEALARRALAGVESARAGLAQAQVAANRAEREMSRLLKLKESGLATQQAVDDGRSEQEAAKARIESSRAQIGVAEEEVRQTKARSAKGLVVAPIDGVVALRNVNVGDLASDAAAAKPIFRIVDNRLLNLTVSVSSVDSAKVRTGQPVEFSVDSIPGKLFTGKVMFVNPELNQADRSLKIIAEYRNVPEVLKGGLFAKGRILTGRRSNVLQVPRSSINGLDAASGKGYLFVIEQGLARRREVTSGVVSGEMVEISSGLKNGEQYVIRGGFNLKDNDHVAVAAKK
ncbi:MAG TPA: efflux RND transporter periplasmic adaptor subunit [Desulfuromonadaceae bacterium]|jgi:RND family efflux transporter MFP subunit